MSRPLWPIVPLFLVFASCAPQSAARDDHSGALSFESCGATGSLDAWDGRPSGPAETLFIDSVEVHGGRYAGRIERTTTSPSTFSSFAIRLPVDFSGDSVALVGWVKATISRGTAGLWMRLDGRGDVRAFDNMQDRPITGSTDWTEYRITLPLDRRARTIQLGTLLSGSGMVWVDDLELLVDGRPMAEAPEAVPHLTVFDRDRAFNAGSGIEDTTLTATQIGNLALLAKVWGFLKYHHPAIVAGRRHFDYDLFRVMPRVLAAKDASAARRTVARWAASLGDVPDCTTCAQLPDSVAMRPQLTWLANEAFLGRDLSATLRTIYARRPATGDQFYVDFVPEVGNPDFSEEAPYMPEGFPDPGYRLLALFRFWNFVEYWSPYREVMNEDWDAVLKHAIPEVAAATRKDDYALAMAGVFARVHDGHANLWSAALVVPPAGDRAVPVVVRFVEGKAVVTGYWHPELGPATGLRVGDIVEAVDGVPVGSIAARCRPWYGVSNAWAFRQVLAAVLLRGDSTTARVSIVRGDRTLRLTADRIPLAELNARVGWNHDHPGPAFRRLSTDLAYLTLSSVRRAEVSTYLSGVAGAKGLIIDLRDYPSDFMVFTLGQHLVSTLTDFACFTRADPANPGAFAWTPSIALVPAEPHIDARVAVLVDEASMSQSEYTTMAFRAAGARIVGSRTAGADGNISRISLPGGLRGTMSGIGVFYPDRRPTQRVGIVPDVEVRPTIAGLRAGRDEVLEAAVREILRRPMTAGERQSLDIR